jgi:hypothetical protein
MKDEIVQSVGKYLKEIWKKVEKDPRNGVLLLVSVMVIYYMAGAIMPFGVLTTISYLAACLMGFSKIIDDPYRPLEWGLGFVICAVAIDQAKTLILPQFHSIDMVSIFAAAVMVYVLATLYMKGVELKQR